MFLIKQPGKRNLLYVIRRRALFKDNSTGLHSLCCKAIQGFYESVNRIAIPPSIVEVG